MTSYVPRISKEARQLLTKAFTLVGGTVNKDFGRDDVAERQEHLHKFCIPKLLGQVINEEVTAFGTWDNEKGVHTKEKSYVSSKEAMCNMFGYFLTMHCLLQVTYLLVQQIKVFKKSVHWNCFFPNIHQLART